MANNDGIAEAALASGSNHTRDFNGGYFSFAFGNEIALVIDGQYYILNCGRSLWEDVCASITDQTTVTEAKAYWVAKSADFEHSGWSADFDDLEESDGTN